MKLRLRKKTVQTYANHILPLQMGSMEEPHKLLNCVQASNGQTQKMGSAAVAAFFLSVIFFVAGCVCVRNILGINIQEEPPLSLFESHYGWRQLLYTFNNGI